ncbi:MAG TPA: isopentenyl phosphate kinase [Nitrososphaerales archaeon]|nr:isopentenyl phosphate kinase [Nitrososphaerales archaeon]
MRPSAVLKMGGSLITKKDEPLSINRESISNVALAISRFRVRFPHKRLIVVHGGGSFGHYYAKKFGVSTISKRASPFQVSKIAESMIRLHTFVLEEFLRRGIPCMSVMAHELVSEKLRLSKWGSYRIEHLMRSGLVPITFGNVGTTGSYAYIISGDKLCELFTKSLPVDRMIFAMDVDGIYQSNEMNGGVLRSIGDKDRIQANPRRYDVTGGVASKISLGLRIARRGTEVFYVNGNKPERLLKVLSLKDASAIRGTIIKPATRKSHLAY